MQWTAEHEALLSAGEPSGGRTLSSKCDCCHGENGVSDDGEIPHLAGQNIKYHYKQLQDFKSKARVDKEVNRRARKLSNTEMANLAAWYASLELPAMLEERELGAPGLVTAGDSARAIPACQACHGVVGRGMRSGYDAPALAGMPYRYLIATLQAFQDGSRANDLGAVDWQFVAEISAEEVKQLAEYYLALGRRQRPPLE